MQAAVRVLCCAVGLGYGPAVGAEVLVDTIPSSTDDFLASGFAGSEFVSAQTAAEENPEGFPFGLANSFVGNGERLDYIEILAWNTAGDNTLQVQLVRDNNGPGELVEAFQLVNQLNTVAAEEAETDVARRTRQRTNATQEATANPPVDPTPEDTAEAQSLQRSRSRTGDASANDPVVFPDPQAAPADLPFLQPIKIRPTGPILLEADTKYWLVLAGVDRGGTARFFWLHAFPLVAADPEEVAELNSAAAWSVGSARQTRRRGQTAAVFRSAFRVVTQGNQTLVSPQSWGQIKSQISQ